VAAGRSEIWAAFTGGGWIDVSRPLRDATPVWPGDRPFVLEQRRAPEMVLSAYAGSCHAGTHLDAPLHLDPAGAAVDAVPLDRLVGPAELLHLPAAGRALEPADLPRGWEPSSSRLLLRTDSYPLDAAVGPGFAALSAGLVHWLAARGVELLGIDTPSVDLFAAADLPAHRALLGRGMSWIENLWLGEAAPGNYLLIALPIRLEGAEAAPLRAILKPMSTEF
jgi:arylformamidase